MTGIQYDPRKAIEGADCPVECPGAVIDFGDFTCYNVHLISREGSSGLVYEAESKDYYRFDKEISADVTSKVAASLIIKECFPIEFARCFVRQGNRIVPRPSLDSAEVEDVLRKAHERVNRAHCFHVRLYQGSAHHLVTKPERCVFTIKSDKASATLDSDKKDLSLYTVCDASPSCRIDEAAPLMGLSDKFKALINLCEAIQSIHDEGYLYLDLKPSNVLAVRDADSSKSEPVYSGDIRLFDFDTVIPINAIAEGALRAVPSSGYWSSPEQNSFDSRTRISVRSDVYSLGAMLFWMIVGRPPEPLEVIEANGKWSLMPRLILDEGFRNLSDPIKAFTCSILSKTLTLEPKERYSSARQLKDQIAVLAAWAVGSYCGFSEDQRSAISVLSLAAPMLPASGIAIVEELDRETPRGISKEDLCNALGLGDSVDFLASMGVACENDGRVALDYSEVRSAVAQVRKCDSKVKKYIELILRRGYLAREGSWSDRKDSLAALRSALAAFSMWDEAFPMLQEGAARLLLSLNEFDDAAQQSQIMEDAAIRLYADSLPEQGHYWSARIGVLLMSEFMRKSSGCVFSHEEQAYKDEVGNRNLYVARTRGLWVRSGYWSLACRAKGVPNDHMYVEDACAHFLDMGYELAFCAEAGLSLTDLAWAYLVLAMYGSQDVWRRCAYVEEGLCVLGEHENEAAGDPLVLFKIEACKLGHLLQLGAEGFSRENLSRYIPAVDGRLLQFRQLHRAASMDVTQLIAKISSPRLRAYFSMLEAEKNTSEKLAFEALNICGMELVGSPCGSLIAFSRQDLIRLYAQQMPDEFSLWVKMSSWGNSHQDLLWAIEIARHTYLVLAELYRKSGELNYAVAADGLFDVLRKINWTPGADPLISIGAE